MKYDAAEKIVTPPVDHEVLVIGYGNLLRSDDGIGPVVAERLRALLCDFPTCRCITAHQLTPELAEPVARSAHVIFIDACVDLSPGKVEVRRVVAHGALNSPFAHHVSPETIICLARHLFQGKPQAWCIVIGIEKLDVGDRLSSPVTATADRLVRHLGHHIGHWLAASQSSALKGSRNEGTYMCS